MEDSYLEHRMKTDGVRTPTSMDQIDCERACNICLMPLDTDGLSDHELAEFRRRGVLNNSAEILLMRSRHIAYLKRGLDNLPSGFVSLDASRPWLMYWILHSLDLLDALPAEMEQRTVDTLRHFQSRTGGFGGGPRQLPHCAPNYAGVLSLLVIGTQAAYEAIDRAAMYRFFCSIKHHSGGFRMHDDGEVDVRGTYTVIAVASLLDILTEELREGVAEYVLSCQTYEGGFGGETWNEAHGGYTFCAFASLVILGQSHRCNLDALEGWLAHRQMMLEGGFQGRTNKLVDGCYSFWQGGAAALLEYARRGISWEVSHRDERTGLLRLDGGDEGLQTDGDTAASEVGGTDADGVTVFNHMVHPANDQSGALLFNQTMVQEYTLLVAQQEDGGLRDKPGKNRDFYHTCYNLSGLSVAQHCLSDTPSVLGDSANELLPTNPVYNIRDEKVTAAMRYFASLPAHTHMKLTQLYTQATQ